MVHRYNFIVCDNKKKCNSDKIWNFIQGRRNFRTIQTVYAGLIILFVPTALCQTDWTGRLTYENIYNSTKYAQIQHQPRPYQNPVFSVVDHFNDQLANQYQVKDQDNELEYEEAHYGKDRHSGTQLLVGFSHDPYRQSMSEVDFVNANANGISPTTSKPENRGKRGVFHLYNMIQCATGCDPLSYKGYGCYCGFLGSGRATDPIDNCCRHHDKCYENIYCPFYTVYFQPYLWKCYHGEPLCALENYNTRNQFINSCSARLCECDRQLAMCLRRYKCPRRRALCRSSPLRLLQNILMNG